MNSFYESIEVMREKECNHFHRNEISRNLLDNMHYLFDQTSDNNNSTSPFKSYLREKRGEEEVTSQGRENPHSKVLIEKHSNHCHSDPISGYSSTSSFDTLLPKNGVYNLDAFFDSDIISLDGSVLEDEEFPIVAVDASKIKPSGCFTKHDEKYEEYISYTSYKGKVLNTFAFTNKEETFPIPDWKRHYDACFTSIEDKVQLSDETKLSWNESFQ